MELSLAIVPSLQVTEAMVRSNSSRNISWTDMRRGFLWDPDVSVYQQKDAFSLTVEGMTPHFVQMRKGDNVTLLNGFPPTLTYPTPGDDASILSLTTKVTPDGARLKWIFELNLTPLRSILPDAPATFTLSIDIAFNSDSNLVSENSVSMLQFDVGSAVLRVLSSYVVLPYLHNADTSQVFHALYAISYKHVNDLVAGKLVIEVRQNSRPSTYGVGYDFVARVYGYELRIELNADAGTVENSPNDSPPSPGLASPTPDEGAQGNEWIML